MNRRQAVIEFLHGIKQNTLTYHDKIVIRISFNMFAPGMKEFLNTLSLHHLTNEEISQTILQPQLILQSLLVFHSNLRHSLRQAEAVSTHTTLHLRSLPEMQTLIEIFFRQRTINQEMIHRSTYDTTIPRTPFWRITLHVCRSFIEHTEFLAMQYGISDTSRSPTTKALGYHNIWFDVLDSLIESRLALDNQSTIGKIAFLTTHRSTLLSTHNDSMVTKCSFEFLTYQVRSIFLRTDNVEITTAQLIQIFIYRDSVITEPR